MKRIYFLTVIVVASIALFSCKKDWLQREPKNLLQDDQIWNDPKQYLSLFANFYNRIPTDMGLDGNWRNMADYDDAMWSGNSNDEGRNNITSYATNRWSLWEYDLIRDINRSIEKMNELGTALSSDDKKQFDAEFRFIRAWIYFEMVRRMGGVPIVTTQLIYENGKDVTELRKPRNKEHEVYDFVASEMDAIKITLVTLLPRVQVFPGQTNTLQWL